MGHQIDPELLRQAIEFEERSIPEEIDELERAIQHGDYDHVRTDAFLQRWRVDAVYRDAAELEMGGEFVGGEI